MIEEMSIGDFFRIAQKYVINTVFDSVNTMMGIVLGLYLSGTESAAIMSISCISAAVAMGISSGTGNYEAEFLEQKFAINEIEGDMLVEFPEDNWKPKAKKISFLVGLVCFLTPVLISLVNSLILIIPDDILFSTIYSMIFLLATLFLMGMYVGKSSKNNPLKTGIRMLIIGLATFGIVYLLGVLT